MSRPQCVKMIQYKVGPPYNRSVIPWYGMWSDIDKCMDMLVQERHNSLALAMRLLSCTNPSVWYRVWTLNHCITAACSVISCLSYINCIRMILLSPVACYQALVMVPLIVSCPLHLAWPMNTSYQINIKPVLKAGCGEVHNIIITDMLQLPKVLKVFDKSTRHNLYVNAE